jgi:hypothetical protein
VLPVVERGVVVVAYGAGSFIAGVMGTWQVGPDGGSVSCLEVCFVGRFCVLSLVVFALGPKPRRDEIGWKEGIVLMFFDNWYHGCVLVRMLGRVYLQFEDVCLVEV